MATLASIPETPRRSIIESRISQRTVAFQRNRPRSRVVVISRRPSRVQRRHRYTVASASPRTISSHCSENFHSAEDGPSSKHLSLPVPLSKDLGSQAGLFESAVSPLNSSPSSLYAPSETSDVSEDLESFPMPPNQGRAWPLPDDKKLPSPPKQTKVQAPLQQAQTELSERRAQDKRRVNPPPTRSAPPPPKQTSQKASKRGSSRQRSAVDEVLVDAISKGVAKQLRLFSFSSNKTTPRQTRKPSTESRTPSQREALDRFTKELKRHADKVGAKGKVLVFTPTPAMSPNTLRTVSALMPYRSEFRAAGLAVTSKDQAQRCPITAKEHKQVKGSQRRKPPKETQQSHVSQLDGKQDSGTNQSTVIDFVGSKDVESWRRALIDQAPVIPPRKQSLLALKGSKRLSQCMPCFNQASTTASSARGYDKQNARTAQASRATRSTGKQRPRTPPNDNPQKISRPFPPQPSSINLCPPKISSKSEQTLESRRHSRASKKPAATFPRRRPQGLRRRSMTINSLIYPSQLPVGQRKPGRTKQQAMRAPGLGGAPLDLIPQASGNLDLHHFAERPFHSLAGDNMDGRMPRVGGFGTAKSMPDIAKSRKFPAGRFPATTSATRRPTPRDHGISKATYAAQEIARHDLGPYPTGIPKPRRPSAKFEKPLWPRRKRSSLLGARRPTPDKEYDDISDRDVLRGLHVAAAAACDESLDGLVHQKTGVHVRRFLADLMAFDSLGYKEQGEDPEERARRRRSQMRKLKQQVRKSREVKRKSVLLS